MPCRRRPLSPKDFTLQIVWKNDRIIALASCLNQGLRNISGNPRYTPEICAHFALVNFAVMEGGLEAQLLAAVVQAERPKLDHQRSQLVLRLAQDRNTQACCIDCHSFTIFSVKLLFSGLRMLLPCYLQAAEKPHLCKAVTLGCPARLGGGLHSSLALGG